MRVGGQAIRIQIVRHSSARKRRTGAHTQKGRGARRTSYGLSFHSLRHTAVSLLKDAGIPEAAVMELVGHDSKRMSAHYTHVGREALEKAAAAFPEIRKHMSPSTSRS